MGYSPWGHKESDTTEQLHFPVVSVTIITTITTILPRSMSSAT